MKISPTYPYISLGIFYQPDSPNVQQAERFIGAISSRFHFYFQFTLFNLFLSHCEL